MEEKDKLPSGEEIGRLANDVMEYTVSRVEKAGYPWYAQFLVIESLYKANSTFAKLVDLLGFDGVNEIAGALRKADEAEVLKQAEEALKEGE